MDSITPAVRQHYAQLDVPIIEVVDDYSTDFTKTLLYLSEWYFDHTTATDKDNDIDVLIMGGLGGRVDQAFSQIHHLAVMQNKRFPQQPGTNDDSSLRMNLYLISEESITFILNPGENIIHTPGTNRPGVTSSTSTCCYLEENVGIIPFLGPTSITTHGFEWDVADWRTQIGGQISTSNHIRADVVRVQSPEPVLFTLELATRLKRGE